MLTKETILSKCQVDSLSKITKISMWGSDIEDISTLSQVPNLTVLSLSVNKIKLLFPLSHCIHLRELYLRKNMVSSLSEIDHLIPCKQLSILWLEQNPICKHPDYYSYITKHLPQITKLDNAVIKQSFPFLAGKETNDTQVNEVFGNTIKRLRRAASSIDESQVSNMKNKCQPCKHEASSFMKFNQINYSLGDLVLQTEKKINSSKSKKDGILFKRIKLKISSAKRQHKNQIPKCIQLNKQPILEEQLKLTQTQFQSQSPSVNCYNIDHSNSNNDHIVKAILILIEKMSIEELNYVSNEIKSMLISKT